MPAFTYKARNGAGDLIEGTLEGVSAGVVADQLRGQALTPVSIVEAQGRPEDPQQCDEKKSQQQAGNDLLIQVHTAPPLADPAATGSRAFSTRR